MLVLMQLANKPISPSVRPVTALATGAGETVAQGLISQARARSPRGLSAMRSADMEVVGEVLRATRIRAKELGWTRGWQ